MACKATWTLPDPSYYLIIDLQVPMGILSARDAEALSRS
jgi:hypothetical protein